MKPIRHILVPTDFGEPAERAIALAIELARPLSAKITLLHVYEIPGAASYEGVYLALDAYERDARAKLDERFRALVEEHADSEAALEQGPAWERILAVAKERGCDLIVMGTHGRSGLERLLIGSVAERVVRASPVPVLTLGHSQA